ncbi:MAG: hypothetical protein AAGA03_14805 [Planctomycetota bacterium]
MAIDHPSPTESLPTVNSSPTCCGGLKRGLAVLAGVIVVGSVAVGSYFAGRQSSTPTFELPPIHATSAVSSEKFSMATGAVSDRAEGLFLLDHNSGLLQCTVVYPRVQQFRGNFQANVSAALGTAGKGGRYVMTTGVADIPRGSGAQFAPTLVYVLDTATGNYACYAIPFSQTMMNANKAQQGALQLLATGTANPMVDRDALR